MDCYSSAKPNNRSILSNSVGEEMVREGLPPAGVILSLARAVVKTLNKRDFYPDAGAYSFGERHAASNVMSVGVFPLAFLGSLAGGAQVSLASTAAMGKPGPYHTKQSTRLPGCRVPRQPVTIFRPSVKVTCSRTR